MNHVECVDLSLVACKGVHQRHVSVFPDFDGLVPGCGDANAGFLGVEEFDT